MKTILFAALFFAGGLTFAGPSTTVKKTTTTVETTTHDGEGKSSSSESSGDYSKGQVGIELLGTGIIYSLFGSFRPHPHFAVNLGATLVPLSTSSTAVSTSGTLIGFPMSVSALLGDGNNNFEVLAGGLLSFYSGTATAKTTASESLRANGFFPTFGAGYRYWPKDGGFHFRATGYMMIISGFLLPTIGLSFGYAF